MKKVIQGSVYVVAGILCWLVAILSDSGIRSLFFGFAGAGIIPGGIIIGKYFYWKLPDSTTDGTERDKTGEKDVRMGEKERILGKTVQYVYSTGLLVIAVSAIVFAALDSLGILENGDIFVVYLCVYMVFQIISAVCCFVVCLKRYKS